MKKRNELQINNARLLKDEELVALKGGDGYSCCACWNGTQLMGVMAAWGQEDCSESCGIMNWDGCWGSCIF